MNSKKQRNKNRRRARKLADQAWEAAADGNLQLAAKIIQRATAASPGNPVLWNDQGRLLLELGEDRSAAEAFQAALLVAPDFAEAYARLAALRIQQGLPRDALALQELAVKYASQDAQYEAMLVTYRALCGAADTSELAPTESETACPHEQQLRREFPHLTSSIQQRSWSDLAHELTERGCVLLPQLLSADDCADLRAIYHQEALFAQTVEMSKGKFGRGVYRYFRAPLPERIDALRRIVYPHLAQIANGWQQELGRDERFPTVWEGFRVRCEQAGQSTLTPLLLRYEAGGFNALHRDIRGDVFFPLQLTVVLSPLCESPGADDGFTGGQFLFADEGTDAKRHQRFPAGLGDAILFCTRSRLVRVGGMYGLQSVQHGVERIESGVRYALGVPFHEYR